jgi:hypothetical protein
MAHSLFNAEGQITSPPDLHPASSATSPFE